MALPQGAPKPAEFRIAELRTGKKHWLAGKSGSPIACTGRFGGSGAAMSKKEVLLAGKALFGRGRFAFEMQELDNSPAGVKRLLKREKELQDNRFGPSDYGYGGFEEGPSDSDNETQRPRGGHRSTETVDALEAFRAAELAAKHSIQVKFDDVDSIETSGDLVTLKLSKPATCYIKPAGEPRHVNMEVGSDITGGARTISFVASAPAPSPAQRRGGEDKAVTFCEIRRLLMQCSPRLEALFNGLPPPAPPAKEVSTPKGKRKRNEEGLAASATKQRRRLTTKQPPPAAAHLQEIKAADGTWLKMAVERFGLRGCLDRSVTDAQWKNYFQSRVSLEMSEAATLRGDYSDSEDEKSGEASEKEEEHHESTFAEATWPPEMEIDSEHKVDHLVFEHGYLEGFEAREAAAGILKSIRSSIKATVASSALKLDPDAVARGMFITDYHINAEEDGSPRTVNAHAVFFAPNGTGRAIELDYEHHLRGRMSFTEHHSHLFATKCDVSAKRSAGRDKVFELDFDEHRRKNPTKTSLATNAALASLGAHLFGVEGAASNRKVFGILVRAVGLGKYGECNGWPVAVARQRFKCGKEECDTDTERIAGDRRLM